MTPLREIRTIHACPVVGPHPASRTNTTTFVAGADGCERIELDAAGLVHITGPWRSVAVPVGVCCWVQFISPAVPLTSSLVTAPAQDTPGSSPKERDTAAHGSGVSGSNGPGPGPAKGKRR